MQSTSEALLQEKVAELEREVAARRAEADSLRASADASEVRAAEADAIVAIARPSVRHVAERLEFADKLLQEICCNVSESGFGFSVLEFSPRAEARIRFLVQQLLDNFCNALEFEPNQLLAQSISVQQDLDVSLKKLFDCENALQNAAKEIALCHINIGNRLVENEKAQQQIILLQGSLANLDRRCLDLNSEIIAAKSEVYAERQARIAIEHELFEIQGQLHHFSQIFSPEVQSAREELKRTRAALVSNIAEISTLTKEISSNRELLLDREQRISAVVVALESARAELAFVQSVDHSKMHELNGQIEALQRDSLSANMLAEANFKTGVRVAELEHQLDQALQSLRTAYSCVFV
jgi:hypothetical protein